MGLYILLALGICLVTAPFGLALSGIEVEVALAIFLLVSGTLMTITAVGLLALKKLWVSVPANMALVRTGRGKTEVFKEEGTLFIHFPYELVRVPLSTMMFDIRRMDGPEAFLTKDSMRLAVQVEFYVRVRNDADCIRRAAISFYKDAVDPLAIKRLLEDKLVSALRSAAMEMDYRNLQVERDAFANAVIENLAPDLSCYGLSVDNVTVSHLELADPATLDPNNIFDARHLKRLKEEGIDLLTSNPRTKKIAEAAPVAIEPLPAAELGMPEETPEPFRPETLGFWAYLTARHRSEDYEVQVPRQGMYRGGSYDVQPRTRWVEAPWDINRKMLAVDRFVGLSYAVAIGMLLGGSLVAALIAAYS